MTEDTWTTGDLPVLRAVVDMYERTGQYITEASDIQAETGFDEETRQPAHAVDPGHSWPGGRQKISQLLHRCRNSPKMSSIGEADHGFVRLVSVADCH
jgi:hypothetical protein